MKSICENCKNRMVIVEEGHGHTECSFIACDIRFISECSHFEERPKDISKNLSEAKELANKGKPPRKQPKKKFHKVYADEGK